MFSFKINPNDKTQIQLVAEAKYPINGWTVAFAHCESDEASALLLKHNLESKFFDLVQEIKKDCYEKGYKDGRKKVAKRNWIHSVFFRKDV